jgi:hypothetical protein
MGSIIRRTGGADGDARESVADLAFGEIFPEDRCKDDQHR